MLAIVITPVTLTGCAANSTDSLLRVSDERLVQAAKGGQSMAFATLCERYCNQHFVPRVESPKPGKTQRTRYKTH
jgi:hypothetical protein